METIGEIFPEDKNQINPYQHIIDFLMSIGFSEYRAVHYLKLILSGDRDGFSELIIPKDLPQHVIETLESSVLKMLNMGGDL